MKPIQVVINVSTGFVDRVSSSNPEAVEVIIIDHDVEYSDDYVASSYNTKILAGKMAYVLDPIKPEPLSTRDLDWINAPYLEDDFEYDSDEPNPTRKLDD